MNVPVTPIDGHMVAGTAAPAEFAVALLAALPDCVKVLDLDGRFAAMSQAGLCALEIDDFDDFRGREWRDLWPEAGQGAVQDAVEAARSGSSTRFTAFCPTAKGAPRWWDVSVTPLRDASGAISRLVSVSRDVTDQVGAAHEVEARRVEAEAALERTRLLLLEVNHRIKNNLALVVSLLRLQARAAGPDAARALAEAAARVQTMARVHDRLYRSERFETVALDDHLGHLCADLDSAFGGEGRARLVTDLAPLTGTVEQAVALGLVVAEMVANAHRHAGLGPEGAIVVRLADLGGGRSRLCIEDDGAGLPEGFGEGPARGLGLRIVRAKAGELDGRLAWETRPGGGAAFWIDFPDRAPAEVAPPG